MQVFNKVLDGGEKKLNKTKLACGHYFGVVTGVLKLL